MSHPQEPPFLASPTLLGAALAGLLAVAIPACGGSSISGSGGAASVACEGGAAQSPEITKTTQQSLSEDAFASLCDAQHGVVEVHPHCGGANSCRGFSYDSGTEALTEHTCRAMNTCAGWSCIVCN
jgi:hypothetical protein